jgi:hypothetical protein
MAALVLMAGSRTYDQLRGSWVFFLGGFAARERRRNTAAFPAAVTFAIPFFVLPFAVETFLRRHGPP